MFKCFIFCDFFHCSACAFDMCLLNYLLTYLLTYSPTLQYVSSCRTALWRNICQYDTIHQPIASIPIQSRTSGTCCAVYGMHKIENALKRLMTCHHSSATIKQSCELWSCQLLMLLYQLQFASSSSSSLSPLSACTSSIIIHDYKGLYIGNLSSSSCTPYKQQWTAYSWTSIAKLREQQRQSKLNNWTGIPVTDKHYIAYLSSN